MINHNSKIFFKIKNKVLLKIIIIRLIITNKWKINQ